MKIHRVTVEVHEKRNHPYEYCHKDCSVILEAEVEDGEDVDSVIARLTRKAEKQVNTTLDAWVAKVILDRHRRANDEEHDY
jgi:hypothetical protein